MKRLAKKLRHEQTQTYKIKQERKRNNQLWQELRDFVIQRDDGCVICHRKDIKHVHHIIPREIKKHKYDVNNLVCLCPLHHKYSFEISAHKNPFAFYNWLHVNKNTQFLYILDALMKLEIDNYSIPYDNDNTQTVKNNV